MLSKKQFMIALVSAVGVFTVIFIIFYTFFYRQGIENPIVQSEATVPVSQSVDKIDEEQVARSLTIGPNTQVTLSILDKEGRLVTQEQIPVESVLGFSEERLKACFTDYEIKMFASDRVVLEKVVEEVPEVFVYKLGLKGDMIGIKEYGENDRFIPLNLSIKDYSRRTQVLLLGEVIELSSAQKATLEKNPHQIEQILQDYSE